MWNGGLYTQSHCARTMFVPICLTNKRVASSSLTMVAEQELRFSPTSSKDVASFKLLELPQDLCKLIEAAEPLRYVLSHNFWGAILTMLQLDDQRSNKRRSRT